jgi:putative ABC transport system permease protein
MLRKLVLAHDLRMALRSLRRTPYVSAMMIGALAVGITASMIAITLYHARTGHPIPWKEHTLFAISLDPRDKDPQGDQIEPGEEYPPPQLTYQDAHALYASDIPVRSVMMYKASQVVTPEREGSKAFSVDIRVTTFEFFKAFDSPFQYGSGWSRADDDTPSAVIVLSKVMNDRLFHGANSVGKVVVVGGHTYRVSGVLASWLPRPKFYDMTNGPFDVAEDVFLPFGWMKAIKLETIGNTNCVSKRAVVSSFDSLLTADCVWLQFWVELRSPSDRERYQRFLDNYTDDQRTNGRFPRKNNNRVSDVSTWLTRFNVVGDETRMLVVLGFVFLGLCILNTVGLLLSKFLTAAPIAGLRRALGASRVDIIRQHLIEVVLVGLLGGFAGLLLTFGGLQLLKAWLFTGGTEEMQSPDRVALAGSFVHMDFSMVLVAISLSLLTGILAGLYPAIRIGRLAPSTFLKTQ